MYTHYKKECNLKIWDTYFDIHIQFCLRISTLLYFSYNLNHYFGLIIKVPYSYFIYLIITKPWHFIHFTYPLPAQHATGKDNPLSAGTATECLLTLFFILACWSCLPWGKIIFTHLMEPPWPTILSDYSWLCIIFILKD